MAESTLGIPARIRLLDLEEQTTVPVEMPNGTTRTLHFYDADGYALFLDVQRTHDNADALRLLRLALPDAPDAELGLLTPKMVTHLVLVAARKIEVATAVLEKNAPGGLRPTDAPSPAADASPPPPSSPPTPSPTPSSGSRGRRGKRSGASSASPTTAPSLP